MSFEVNATNFKGPLELLLSLVQKSKLTILELNLANLCDDYLAYLAKLEAINYEDVAEFLWIAARLVYLKTRHLLPNPQIEEELMAGELEDRLARYQALVAAANRLQKIAELGVIVGVPTTKFTPTVPLNLSAAELGISVSIIHALWLNLYQGISLWLKPRATLHAVNKISLAEGVARLTSHLARLKAFSFTEFCGDFASKGDLVVHFLSVLELWRRGEIVVNQSEQFGEISLSQS